LLDFTVRYDTEVIIEPEETTVEQWGYWYFDVHQQVAIAAITDSNGIFSGCRDSIALQ